MSGRWGRAQSLVVGHADIESGGQDGEKAIGASAKGASMRVAGGAEALMLVVTPRIELGVDAGLMIKSVAHSGVAGLTHHDAALLAALFGGRGDAGIGAQNVIMSLGNRL